MILVGNLNHRKNTEMHENRPIYTYLFSCDISEFHFQNAFEVVAL